MFFRLTALVFLAALLSQAAPKKTVFTARGENQDLIVTFTVYTTPEDVKELLGSDLEGHYMVADVKVEPKYGKDIVISHDDFVLRDMEAVEKSTPLALASRCASGRSNSVADAPARLLASPNFAIPTRS